jgi:hypothetical protein
VRADNRSMEAKGEARMAKWNETVVRARRRARWLRVTGLTATVVAALALPAAAQADPVALEFDNGVLDLGAQKGVVFITPGGTHATMAIDQDPATGDFTTAAPGDVTFPDYSFTDPVPGQINLSAASPVTDGAFDAATGQMSFSVNLHAEVTLPGGTCVIDPIPVALSTEGTAPYAGVRYTGGSITGNGAVVASWQSLPIPATQECQLVGALGQGPGGLWLSKGIAPPSAGGNEPPPAHVPKIGLTAKPRKAKVEAGKKAKFGVTVTNQTNKELASAMVCAKAPKPLELVGKRCRTFSAIAGFHEPSAKFKVATSRDAIGKHKLTFTATAPGAANASAKAKLKVVE